MGPSITHWFEHGGPFAYVITFPLGFALVIAVERWVALALRYKVSASFLEQIDKLVASGNFRRASELCRAAPAYAPLPKVLRAVLIRASQGPAALSKAREDALATYASPMQKRIPWILAAGQAATLLGVTGTVVGVIDAAQRLSDVAPEKKQAVFLERAAEAANHLVLAGIVGGLCVVAYWLLKAYAKARMEAFAGTALRLEATLARHAQPRQSDGVA